MPTVSIDERGATPTSLTEASGGPRRRILIISPGTGSSATYPAEVLERDGPQVIRAGTHMYVDHPTATDAHDRPERTLRDLVGVLETDAVWDPSGTDGPGLYADAKIFAEFETFLTDAAEHVGVSIRGYGTADANGQLERLEAVESVDFVTRAGRGGKVLELLEAARDAGATVESAALTEARRQLTEARNVGQWMESHIHLDFTISADQKAADGLLTRDERIALSHAIGQALDAFRVALEQEAPHLYERDPYAEPDPTPVDLDEDDTTTDDPEADVPTIEELEARIATLEGDLTAVRDERDGLAEAARDRAAADVVAEAIAASDHDLAAPTVTRVTESVLRDVPVGDDGTLDTAALTEAVGTAIASEVEYLTGVTPPAAKLDLGEARDGGADDGDSDDDGGDKVDLDEASSRIFG